MSCFSRLLNFPICLGCLWSGFFGFSWRFGFVELIFWGWPFVLTGFCSSLEAAGQGFWLMCQEAVVSIFERPKKRKLQRPLRPAPRPGFSFLTQSRNILLFSNLDYLLCGFHFLIGSILMAFSMFCCLFAIYNCSKLYFTEYLDPNPALSISSPWNSERNASHPRHLASRPRTSRWTAQTRSAAHSPVTRSQN